MTTSREFRREALALWHLALPVVLSQMAIMGIGLTDVLFAGRAGTDQLAGVTLGANTWNLFAYFFFAIGLSAQILVGRHFGARDEAAIRQQVQQSLWSGLLCGFACMLVLGLAVVAIGLVHFDPEVRRIGQLYVAILIPGGFAMALIPVLRTSIEAMNQTRVVMVVNLSAFLLNIPLDYALVFGKWGFPALGGVGCAIASTLVIWASLLAFYLLLSKHPANRGLAIFHNFQPPHWAQICSTLQLGLPIGYSVLIELSFFCGAGILITLFGAVSASAHAIAISLASMSFMIYMGLGQGITIRAAQSLGAGLPIAARFSVRVGLTMTFVLASLISMLLVSLRHWLPGLYTQDVAVISLASQLLLWAAIFQLADATQICAVSGMRAYKDTATPPRYMLVAFWLVAFPLALWLAYFAPWPALQGPTGYWAAMVAGLTIAAFRLLRRLRFISAEEIRQHVGPPATLTKTAP